MTDTMISLLAAIRAHPGEDTPRLMFADAAIEAGFEEWGGFVKVQCELAKLHESNYPCFHDLTRPKDCEMCVLRRRERELWPAVRKWFEGEGYELTLVPEAGQYRYEGSRSHQIRPGEYQVESQFSGPHPTVLISRGFPCRVRCTLDQWRGGECENCGGFGEFRRRHDNGDGPEGPCPDCGGKWNSGPHDDHDDYWDKGTGRTPGVGPRLAQRWPIERVEVTDKHPVLVDGNRRIDKYVGHWIWWQGDDGGEENRGTLPRSIIPENYRNRVWNFDSDAAARAALSAALIAAASGLPSLYVVASMSRISSMSRNTANWNAGNRRATRATG